MSSSVLMRSGSRSRRIWSDAHIDAPWNLTNRQAAATWTNTIHGYQSIAPSNPRLRAHHRRANQPLAGGRHASGVGECLEQHADQAVAVDLEEVVDALAVSRMVAFLPAARVRQEQLVR